MAQVRKTAKYYCNILNGNDVRLALSVIPEVIKKFGFVDEYHSEINFPRDVVHKNFNWNHSIEGFNLSRDGKLYAKVYWQGDSTDGTECVLASYLIGGYTIKAAWDNVGGSWGMECRHSPLEVTTDELSKAIKAIVPLLSADLIKARRKRVENEPFVMPMYGRINRWMTDKHPFNKWGNDTYKEKHNNAKDAILALMIPEAKKYMQMNLRECEGIFDKIYELNYITNEQMPKDEKGNKMFHLAV